MLAFTVMHMRLSEQLILALMRELHIDPTTVLYNSGHLAAYGGNPVTLTVTFLVDKIAFQRAASNLLNELAREE